MDGFLLFCALVSVVDLAIVAAVFVQARDRALNRVFAALGLASALWMTAIGLAHSPHTSHVLFVRSTFAAASLLVLAVLTFVHVFPHTSFPRSPLYRTYAGVGLALVALAYTSAVVRSASYLRDGLTVSYGPLHPVFGGYALIGVLASLALLAAKARTATGYARLEFRYLVIAIAAPAIGISTTNLVIPLISKVSRQGRFGPAFVVIFLAITAHAVIRHRLMSVRLVASRIVAHTVAGAATGAVFVAAAILEHRTLGVLDELSPALHAAALFIGAVSLLPVMRRLRRVVDRYLYRAAYDYRRTVREASVELAALVELPVLLEYLCAVFERALGSEPVTVYLLDRASADLRRAMSTSHEPATEHVPAASPLRAVLGSGMRPFLADDPSDLGPEACAASRQLVALGGQYAQPIMVDRDLLGFVLLGPKRSGDPYFQEDLDLVSTVVNAAAVAIRNAELYHTLRIVESERQRNGRLAALGGMASGIAHEIKNPLVAIRTFTELLPERFADEEFRTDFAGVALREIDRIDGLIDRLRGLAAASEYTLAPIDVTEPLEDVLTLLKGRLEQAAVSVVSVFEPELPRIAGSGDQLKQLFLNVLTNALDAMPEGGDIGVRIAAHGALGQSVLAIEVADRGSGIPGEMLQAVFEPFVTTKAKGTGLGLAICRGIVDAHGGSITIGNNADGPGAIVRIEFPIADSPSRRHPDSA